MPVLLLIIVLKQLTFMADHRQPCSHNDRLCDLMTMQTQAQVETAKAIQLLAVRIENIERKLEK